MCEKMAMVKWFGGNCASVVLTASTTVLAALIGQLTGAIATSPTNPCSCIARAVLVTIGYAHSSSSTWHSLFTHVARRHAFTPVLRTQAYTVSQFGEHAHRHKDRVRGRHTQREQGQGDQGTGTDAYAHAHTHMYMYTCIHAHTHAHAHAHTCTRMRTWCSQQRRQNPVAP